ncbi:hypothetical protein [Flavonifractor sp. An306]|mgnify:FL=1|uniref:hypothetical protein n=1 Tax=Flavonifractor sp. An306 TaxID=1965629 RepID=UPI001749EE97|nr:hypothetical protein [Flavonifractor sp. An306]
MRLYLIIPLVISSDLVFFAGDGVGTAVLNRMAQLLMVLGDAWAVLQSGSVITGILAGNPGMTAIQQEGRIGGMVTAWAMRAPRAALGTAGSLTKSIAHLPQSARDSQTTHLKQAGQRADLATRKAMARQGSADAMFQKAEEQKAAGASAAKVNRTMRRAQQLQKTADRASAVADRRNFQAGRRPPAEGYGRVQREEHTSAMSDAAASVGASSAVSAAAVSARAASEHAAAPETAPPIPSRSRNPYTPEMYASTAYQPSGSSSGGGSAGDGSSSVQRSSAAYSNLVAGKRWTPPSLSGEPAPSASHAAPQPVPPSEQYVSAVISTADAPRARSSAPADSTAGGGSHARPSSPPSTPPGNSGSGSGSATPPRRKRE